MKLGQTFLSNVSFVFWGAMEFQEKVLLRFTNLYLGILNSMCTYFKFIQFSFQTTRFILFGWNSKGYVAAHTLSPVRKVVSK